jgi:CNT family concentrative nucleoside transporter
MSVLFHLGVMQWVVKGMARLMVWIMDVSGAESLAASANVFVGHTEAPLVIRPYLKTMTPSELMAMLTGGMATIAGGVLAAYAGFVTNAGMAGGAGHLLTASFMSAPASLVIAKIMFPETLESPTKATVKIDVASEATNVIDAACRGAGDGLRLALNVGAMLIAFVAIIFMLNGLLAAFCTQVLGVPAISFQQILGYVMAPFAWLMGVPWDDCLRAGQLLGTKTVLNEFIAYLELARMIKAEEISPRGAVILTYALCGFANFGSIAVQIGGIGDLVPERRADIAKLGIKAMIGGTLAAFMTATVAGVLITTPDAWPVKP